MDNNLSRIKIKGFKSIKALDLEMKPINVLIGANGSGKSNFISVFKLLDVLYQKKLQTYISTNGKAERFLHFGSQITQEIIIDLSLSDANTYFLKLAKDVDNDSFVIDIDNAAFTVYRKTHDVSYSSLESNISNETSSGIIENSKNYLQQCKLYHFHDTSEKAKFKSNQDIKDNDFLWSDAGNLAPFLLRLSQDYPEDYQNIVSAIQTVASYFHDFSFKKDSKDVLLRWQHKNNLEGVGFSANNLSDGTARFICMATLFLQPKELRPATIVLDEPEIGLHPVALTVLSEIIKAVSNDGSQVIISTQSVTLANCFKPDDFIVVDYVDGVSSFRRLKEQELDVWLEEYQMGDIWNKGLLGGRPW
ncbi:hypothetical protein BHECKSOX_1895 [Bathymodiolus heckerae thiotrophic gill symbiont]|uniref:AAA family ATPase n=1 Tax=Bathymodiolus heckerae thiotrophic gill symbiont TaxID=1052212 RepID=UPI0010B882DC|nr:AAA family ATPase [Bathymodiolus heckerae thiotrophic gill symbiont]SHN92938.1 hypothetical protein BHECKSOX_1895 [Bathymodiolus heckerae thiotrophic gill symbiont]